MTIRITPEHPLSLTRRDFERLHREWSASQSMTTCPQEFESWVRGHRKQSLDARLPTPVEDFETFMRVARLRFGGDVAPRAPGL